MASSWRSQRCLYSQKPSPGVATSPSQFARWSVLMADDDSTPALDPGVAESATRSPYSGSSNRFSRFLQTPYDADAHQALGGRLRQHGQRVQRIRREERLNVKAYRRGEGCYTPVLPGHPIDLSAVSVHAHPASVAARDRRPSCVHLPGVLRGGKANDVPANHSTPWRMESGARHPTRNDPRSLASA
jgi:hypothetical protein